MRLSSRPPLSSYTLARRARGQVTLSLMLLSAAGTLAGVLPNIVWIPPAALAVAGVALLVLVLGIVNLLLSRRPSG